MESTKGKIGLILVLIFCSVAPVGLYHLDKKESAEKKLSAQVENEGQREILKMKKAL